MSERQRAYWDACAWLGLINSEPEKVKPLRHIYNLARRGQFEIWTSTISYVEVFRLKSESQDRKPLDDEKLDIIRDVIEQPFVRLVPVDMEIGREARQLRRNLDFRGASDAVHLASAAIWSISPLYTWDKKDLVQLSGQIDCKNGSKLEICYPEGPKPGPLFSGEDGNE